MKWFLLIVLVGTLGWLTTVLVDRVTAVLPLYDFVAFWSAGRLLLTGNNPYSAEQLYALQKSVGSTYGIPMMFWNPPWTLLVTVPFGLLDYPVSRVLWLWLNLALVLLSVEWAWRLYGGSTRRRWLAQVVGFTFFPTLSALYLGQMGPLVLAGVVGFLHFERRRQWWLAGAVVLLIAIKPHRFYLFWVALLLWVLDRRQWSILLGGGLAGLGSTAISLFINPSVINQFLHGTTDHAPFYWMTPTLGTLLRVIFGWEKAWLPFLPAILGVLWFLFYWRRHRRTWVWPEQMPVLLMASMITAPLTWTHDQVVLLPALLQATVWLIHSRQRLTISLAVVVYVAISGLALLPILPSGDHWRIWMVPALLAGYLILRRQTGHQPGPSRATNSTARPLPTYRGTYMSE
ncbi:MAG: glycosyltransferase family 87 protein [Anaerolineae bacterium]